MNRNPFGEASDEFEADAPLSVFEDLDSKFEDLKSSYCIVSFIRMFSIIFLHLITVELTTRAPLTTKKPDLTIEGINKNPNRNANRKPKPRN